VDGFYDELLLFINKMVQKGFVQQVYLELVLISDNIDELLHKMENYQSQ